MKTRIAMLLLMFLSGWVNAQMHLPDSTILALKTANNDSLTYDANHRAYLYFEEINKDSALYYNDRCLLLAKKDNKKLVLARCLASKAYQLTGKGQYAEALKNLLEAFAIAEDPKNASNSWFTSNGWFTNKRPSPEQTRVFVLALTHHMYAILMRATQNTRQQIIHFKEARKLAGSINNVQRVMLADMNLGQAYVLLNKIDSASIFLNEAKEMTLRFGPRKYFSYILMSLGDIARKQSDKTKAKHLYYEGITSAIEQKNHITLTWLYLTLTDVYLGEKQKDSSLYFAKKAFETFNTLGIYSGETINTGTVYQKLYDGYQLRGQSDSAYKYSGLALAAKEKINASRIKSLAQFQSISLKEQLRLQDLEKEKELYQSKVRTYALVAGLGVFLIIGIILWRNNRRQKQTNLLLNEQKEEISAQRDNLKQQNHELEIEAALERVRARTMAMQRSEELAETVFVLFQQFKELGENPDQATIGIFNEEERVIEYWVTMHGNQNNKVYKFSIDEPNVTRKIYDAWKAQKSSLVIDLSGRPLHDFMEYRASMGGAPAKPDEKRRIINVAFFSKGLINVQSTVERSEESVRLLERFARVFEQTYTRFLDLQKAEAQAREAEIQLALERIRARTTAMQKSEELHEVIQVVFDQLHQLNFAIDNANFILNYQETDDLDLWLAVANGRYPTKINIPYLEHPAFDRFNKAKEKGGLYADTLSLEEKNSFFEHFFKHLPNVPAERKTLVFSQPGFARSAVFMKNTALAINNYQGIPYSEIENNILLRFGHVFDETYTRFNDLKQAEAQVREAQIEAALERVRSKAMAMHDSNDLSSAVSLVFTELKKLGIRPIRCGVGMLTKESRRGQLYSATISDDGSDTLGLVGWIELKGHPIFEKIYDSWLNQYDYFPVLNGKELKAYYRKLLSGLHLPSVSAGKSNEQQYGHFLQFAEGCLYAWAERPYSEAERKILDRFKGIISLTFKRYLDLQKAEASTLEAIKQASVDRVRAEIASMRTTLDLERITPLIWTELTILNVPFIRCGVFIIDEQQQLIHSYLSTPDGKALAAFDLQFDAEGIAQNVLQAWRNKQIATIHWTQEEFSEYTKNLVEQGTVNSQERYVTEHPDTSLDLHFLPFLQGMLYVGNITPLNQDKMHLVQSLAAAFSTAYARYEDFNKLEAAKQQVDNALTQLKATQNKLIQSEKMASLGELTAGIAHEIQNPLNFVNNFSDVNKEMLEELKAESIKPKAERDEQLEAELINDLIENEQKINHHGKRADAIVKGMLQHSRASSGQKEPTDLNALADEYLRLSYHGLRAKDKSFNAELIANLDKNLPKINVTPQDMGHVLLNLFNNAFYAVNQKSKTAGSDYKPTVVLTTLRANSHIEIRVKDNGNGIPDNIKDKVMQPFFTTKPTGEGTGLGLSLSYDIIVKGHNGKINIESKEGEGSEFIIDLLLA